MQLGLSLGQSELWALGQNQSPHQTSARIKHDEANAVSITEIQKKAGTIEYSKNTNYTTLPIPCTQL